jgi:hypothetical protein
MEPELGRGIVVSAAIAVLTVLAYIMFDVGQTRNQQGTSGVGWYVGAAILLVLAGSIVVGIGIPMLVRRWRRTKETSQPEENDPAEVDRSLRQWMFERAVSMEHLAEMSGYAVPLVRSATQRMIAAGTAIAVPSDTGEERYQAIEIPGLESESVIAQMGSSPMGESPSYPRSIDAGANHIDIGDELGGHGSDHLSLEVSVVSPARSDPKRPGETYHLVRIRNLGQAGFFRANGWWVDHYGYPLREEKEDWSDFPPGPRWSYSLRGEGETAAAREQQKVFLKSGDYGSLYICKARPVAQGFEVWPLTVEHSKVEPWLAHDPSSQEVAFMVSVFRGIDSAHYHVVLVPDMGKTGPGLIRNDDVLEYVLDGGAGS